MLSLTTGGVENELAEMAADGWQIEQVHINGLWVYKKAQPAEKDFTVVFAKMQDI